MASINTEKLNEQVKRNGLSMRGFCAAHKIAYSSMIAWLAHKRNPKVSTVFQLARYLKCNRSDISDDFPERSSAVPQWLRNAPGAPVIAVGDISKANTATMSLPEWARGFSQRRQVFPSEKKDDFAVMITGDGFLPRYMNGTLLLCRAIRPDNGDLVVAVFESGEVRIQKYAEGKTKFALLPADAGDTDKLVFDKSSRTEVRGVYVVIESFRREKEAGTVEPTSYPELD